MLTLCGPFTARPPRRRPYERFVDSWVGDFWICRRSTCSEATAGLGGARHADFDARSPREGLFLALKPQEKRRFHFWGVAEMPFDALPRRPSSGWATGTTRVRRGDVDAGVATASSAAGAAAMRPPWSPPTSRRAWAVPGASLVARGARASSSRRYRTPKPCKSHRGTCKSSG